MKKILKRLTVYLTIAMVLCCSFFVPASAASADVPISPYKANDNKVYHQFQWLDLTGSYARLYMLPVGEYTIDTLFDSSSVDGLGISSFKSVCWYDNINKKWVEVSASEFVHFIVTADMLNSAFGVADRCMLAVNCIGYSPSVYPYRYADDTTTGVYYQVFDLFSRFIYGEGAELTSDQTLVLTMISTTCVLLVVAVPFLVVLWFFKIGR